jgi:hypothetical protein
MAALLSCCMVVVLLTALPINHLLSLQSQNAIAANASNTVMNVTNLNLGSPFYIEKDKTTSVTLVTINGIHAARVTFSGNGTTKGVSFTDKGTALSLPGPYSRNSSNNRSKRRKGEFHLPRSRPRKRFLCKMERLLNQRYKANHPEIR